MRVAVGLVYAMAASQAFLYPRSQALRCAPASATDDEAKELDRLRDENSQLKQDLARRRGLSPWFGGLSALDRAWDDFDAAFGSLTKRFDESSPFGDESVEDDVAAVVKMATDQAGIDIQEPFSKSYASSNVNGRVEKRVDLVARATDDDAKAKIVKIQASIDNDGVITINDLHIDDDALLQGGDDGEQGGAVVDVKVTHA